MHHADQRKIDEISKHIEEQLLPALVMDYVKEMPAMIKPLQEAKLDLNRICSKDGRTVLQYAITRHHCLAYLLDFGLDPFVLGDSKLGWSAVHYAIFGVYNLSQYRLMGFAFTAFQFPRLKTRDGMSVKTSLSRLSAEEQAAFRETQTIFCTYRSYHDSAERAANLAPPDHLLAALYYFLAASQMKTKVADEEDDDYLKRFHLKKVVGDLRKAIAHYHQAILKRKEVPAVLDELDRCLVLSEEMIRTVVLDNPEKDWEIKLGGEVFFADWRVQLEALQKWREERRISFSSTSSDTSTSGVEVDVKSSGETEDEAVSLLGQEGLRCRK